MSSSNMASERLSQPAEAPGSSRRPSSSSTHIAVGLNSVPEEQLYAAAAALREATHFSGETAASVPMSTSDSSSTQSTPTTSISENSDTGPAGKRGSSESSPPASAAPEAGAATLSFDSDMSRYPESMASSVRDYVYEGGMRYHAYHAGKYAFPNDEVEQNRDDMKHTLTLLLCRGAFFYAPIDRVLEEGGEVLDLGTGTGIWAIELGDKYPNAAITAIDLSPIQPNFVPENVHFFVDDFEEEWVDPENKYDFIHLRHTLHSVRDLETLLTRALRHLKPGGYFEAQELSIQAQCDDDTLTPETPYALRDYLNYMSAAMQALGSNAHAILSLPDVMTSVGFVDVERTLHKCPLGVWPLDKRLRLCGLFTRTVIMDGLSGLSRRPLAALGWTPLQIEMFLIEVRKAIMDPSVHTYFTLHVVYGRKPLG